MVLLLRRRMYHARKRCRKSLGEGVVSTVSYGGTVNCESIQKIDDK